MGVGVGTGEASRSRFFDRRANSGLGVDAALSVAWSAAVSSLGAGSRVGEEVTSSPVAVTMGT
eukprot:2572984-Pyramimonas_sp.AAC.1